ncbi:MAG: dihydrodipicolinate reductase [Rhodothermales bacterium]|nr:dihydrodipicolinate reductase [Rhodothermales bacterium]
MSKTGKQSLRVVQFGIGPIGASTLRTVLSKGDAFEVVGAIDVDPAKVGRDAALVAGRDTPCGVKVRSDADAVLRETKPDVVLHTTSSFLDRMYDQLIVCARAGCNVVSSTEELSYPYHRHPRISQELDAAARENGVTLLGTGVNPGYAMDALALMATGVCNTVKSIRVRRVVDAGKRRLPLQMKVGAGLSEAKFNEKKATGTFGHIGLVESLYMVAEKLGWTLDRIDERLNPVISTKEVVTPYLTVESGQVAGIHHAAEGFVGERQVVSLDLKMYVGADDPVDAVTVVGDPPIDLAIRGGIFGDTATVAALINAAPLVRDARPGLVTVADIPLPRAYAAVD